MVKPIPEGFHTVTPTFTFKDCRKAIDFYKKAFGAVEQYVMQCPTGKGIMHASIKIGDSTIMMGEENANCPCKSAETLGGSPIALYLYVNNVDAAFDKAVNAGCKTVMEVQDMFWGDRAGTLTDPFGYNWTIGTHIADLTPEEIKHGAEEFMACAAK
jgi:PhnB protein